MSFCSAALDELLQGIQPELVLHDLDGTLINSVPDLASAIDSMLAHFNLPLAGEERVSHWVGNGADKLIRRALVYAHPAHQTVGGIAESEQAADVIADDLVTEFRQVFDSAYLSALHRATGVYNGVQTWLDELSRRDVAKVLITNKPRLFTEPLIESLGWQHQFVQLICGDDLAEKKPSPLPLLHACHTQNVGVGQTLMIGDSRHDVLAAQRAGIKTVAVSYGYNHGEDIRLSNPGLVVDNLAFLIEGSGE